MHANNSLVHGFLFPFRRLLRRPLHAFASAFLCAVVAAAGCGRTAEHDGLIVSAASSLARPLGEAAKAYTAETGQPVQLRFASSGALARQIESGAPCDVFISADARWTDYLIERGFGESAGVTPVAANQLVVVSGDPTVRRIDDLVFVPAFGRLILGDPDSVPAGRYAKQSLERAGAWPRLTGRMAWAGDVRMALALVACNSGVGIVYRTDAVGDERVTVVHDVDAWLHDPIVYPALSLNEDDAGAAAFVVWLRSDAGRAIFVKHGFSAVNE